MSDAGPRLDGLPGGVAVAAGIRDLLAGRETVEALLVSVAVTRLRELGLLPAGADRVSSDPEVKLYRALGSADDPFFEYKARVAELDSFLAAFEARVTRAGG